MAAKDNLASKAMTAVTGLLPTSEDIRYSPSVIRENVGSPDIFKFGAAQPYTPPAPIAVPTALPGPATAPAAPQWSVPSGSPQSAQLPWLIERNPITAAYRAKPWDQDQRGLLDITAQSLASDPALRRTMEWGLGTYTAAGKPQYVSELQSLFNTAGASPTGNFSGYQRPSGISNALGLASGAESYRPPISPGIAGSPVYPASGTWQQKAQYWKDLAARTS